MGFGKAIGESFGALFPVVNPIAVIPVFLVLTAMLGGQLVRFIGDAGIDALRRIFGLLVLAIGVEMIVHGINEHKAFRKALALGLF